MEGQFAFGFVGPDYSSPVLDPSIGTIKFSTKRYDYTLGRFVVVDEIEM